ncbi:hypothetical protein GCM10028806_58410 [Spirosoma terrae]|uniref:Uncharacterized protein n=1 Tax=Spirosoma terrae TaxID=1968276 RepID=A0A6L9LFM8_9BACT|nr:hypothetical protein [Spirosoma terrae]NDU99180.1 hypothetical protein [Spirosoma terrae]
MKKVDSGRWVMYLIIGALIFVTGKQIYKKIMLTGCHRVTVAFPYGVSGSYKTGHSLNFRYKVNGEKYEASCSLKGRVDEQRERNLMAYRRYVRFSCKYPSLSEIVTDKEVPAWVAIIPAAGWDKVPE